MKKRFLRTAAAIVAAAVLLRIEVFAAPDLSARSAILLDGHTGQILWQKNAHEQSLVASTTKIMTGLLICEQCDLSENVQIPQDAVGIEGSSIYLQPGERLTVGALLYGMMLRSGNDAASALAIHCAGSEDAFADMMNDKCQKLGLRHSHFSNPHGLDEKDHYSTAYDLGLLTCAAMNNRIFHKVVSTKEITLDGRHYVNHNKLLWQYDGAVGVKTGYTRAAGRILVSCAEKSGRRLVAVTISDPDDWNDHRTLLDYGFSQFVDCRLMKAGETAAGIPVISGTQRIALAVTGEEIRYAVLRGDTIKLMYDLPKFVYAPVVAGTQAGSLRVLVNDMEVKQYPLYWRETIMEGA